MSLLRWLTFAIGWLLSPLTPWNDAILNIPLAYVMASLIQRILPDTFAVSFFLSYWLTNLAGILMVIFSGHKLIKERPFQVRTFSRIWIWSFVFSGLVLLLIWRGWVKPF